MIDLFWSAVALLTFWLLGALVFSAIEGWTYGRVHHRGGGSEGADRQRWRICGHRDISDHWRVPLFSLVTDGLPASLRALG